MCDLGISHSDDHNQYKTVLPSFGAAYINVEAPFNI